MEFYHHWPIRPKRVYYHKDEIEKIGQNGDNLTAVFSKSHVQGWLYELILRFNDKFDKLQEILKFPPPMSLIQFTQSSIDTAPSFESLGLDLMNGGAHKVCHFIRETQSKQIGSFCKQFDDVVASCFLGKSANQLHELDKKGITEKINELANASGINDHAELPCSYNEEINLLHYTCPLSKVSIIAIPVILSDVVIAVFIIGQFIRKGRSDIVKKNVLKFGSTRTAKTNESFQELEDSDYHKICDFFLEEVSQFTKHLDERMHRNADTFIFKSTLIITERINQIKNATEIYSDLCKILTLQNITMYSLDTRKRLDHDWQLAKTNGFQVSDEKQARYPTAKLLKNRIIQDRTCKIHSSSAFIPKHSESFPYGFRNNSTDLSLLIVTYQDDDTIRFAFHLTPTLSLDEKEKDRLAHFLESISSVLYARKLLFDTKMQKDQYDLTLKMVGHELGQQILAANAKMMMLQNLWSAICVYAARPELSDSDFDLVYKDMESILGNVSMQAELAKSRSNARTLTKRTYLIFDYSLFKVRNCFRMYVREKSMRLEFNTAVRNDDQLRPSIYGDQSYIEEAVFNLVNNAIKYGYSGTIIYLDCKKNNTEKDTPHIITVRDYGCGIPQDMLDEIFKLNVRVNKNFEGEGFGLFLVREIAERHAGKAYCVCDEKPISKFNVPLIQTCIDLLENSEDQQDIEFRKELLKEKKSLQLNGYYDRIVNAIIKIDERTITRNKALRDVRKPTYEVTFMVEIAPMHIQLGVDENV